MATIGNVVVKFGADIAGFTSDVNRATKLSRKQSQAILTSFKRMGVGIAAGMAVAINEAVKFEKAMDEVSTLVGDTTDMDALTDSVREMSREFGKMPVDQAKALYQIISAGASTASEQMDLLTASNKLAIGGVTEVAIAADALTTILNAYGMEASQATDISDLLFVGMKQGKTTVEEMGLSIGKVATIAAQTGVPINELIAGVATLTKSGIGTSEAMSGLQGVLSAVLKQSKQSVDMADKLGVAFNAQALEAKGLAKFLDDIQVAADGDVEKLQKLFGRVEGLTAVMSLGADGAKEFNAILEETGNRAGATDEAFNKMAQGSAFQLDKLKVSISLLAEGLGAKLLPGVNMVAEAMVKLLTPTRDYEQIVGAAEQATTALTKAMQKNASISKFQAAIATATKEIIALESEIQKVKEKQESWWRKSSLASKVYGADLKFLEGRQKELFREMRKAESVLKAEIARTKESIKVKKEVVVVVEKVTEEIKKEVKQVESLTDSLEELKRSLDPIIRLEEDFNTQVAILTSALAAGEMGRDEFNQWLEMLEANYNDAIKGAVGFKEETTEAVEEIAEASAGVAAVIENSFKRLDDTFQSFWSNLIKNGKLSLQSIKDLFLDTIAQMLHAAITQPIVLRIGAAMTGGLVSGAASAAGGALGGAGGLFGGLAGGGISGLFSNFTSIFTGSGIQQAFANFSDIFSGGAANWQFGLAGIVGGILGDKIFGGQGGIGGGIGAVIGTALLPGIGSVIGGLLGGAIGGLFGDRDPQIFGAGSLGRGDVTSKGLNASALGGFFLGGGRGGVGEFRTGAIDALQQFDSVIASFLSANQLEKVTSALASWSIRLDKEGVTIENLLDSRFAVILGSFSGTIQDYVNQFEGLEAQTEALQRYVTALNTVGMAITAFADSNAADVLAAMLEDAATSSTEKLSAIGTALTDLFDNFDGTPEQLNQISQMIDARYRGELEYLNAVNQLIIGIAQSIEAQQNRIREAVEGPQSFGALMGDAEALFRSLGTAASPEEIASIVSGIQSLIDKAFGGLDEAGQIAQADTLIAFLDQVEQAATARAEVLAQMVVDQGQILRDQALVFADVIGAPLDLNIQATQDVSAAVNNQTEILVDEHRTGQAIDSGIKESIDRLNENLLLVLDSQPRTIGG